jgi:hypothetical protein
MPLNMLIVPTYSQMLTTLAGWLDKAQAQLPAADAQALLSARLAPDMYPLSTQIRFACVQAYEAVHRLQGQALPPLVDMLLNEGRNAGEQPGSLQDARARIDDSIAMLAAVSADTPAMSADAAIAHTLPNGIILDLTAQQYARDWTLSQFYFHVMTAYAILRAQGVQLGKADYVAHMFGHIRPGTLPQG